MQTITRPKKVEVGKVQCQRVPDIADVNIWTDPDLCELICVDCVSELNAPTDLLFTSSSIERL